MKQIIIISLVLFTSNTNSSRTAVGVIKTQTLNIRIEDKIFEQSKEELSLLEADLEELSTKLELLLINKNK